MSKFTAEQKLETERKMGLCKKKYDGFYQIASMPTQEEVSKHYAEKYYQSNAGHYQSSYTEEELEYHINFGKRFEAWVPDEALKDGKTVLDVGCGEGFCMEHFRKIGYEVTGLDFSREGMEMHNKHLTEHTRFGDVYELLNETIESGKTFSVIILKHVLEHVLDPEGLLQRLKKLVSPNGVIIILVPNDFSSLQLKLVEEEKVTPFWIAPPEHLSYWTREGLERFVDENGYKVLKYTSDYPIDFDLVVEHTNYNRNGAVGKFSHLKRVRVTNLLCEQSAAECNEHYRSLAKMGMGRELIFYLQPK
jgi:2-polyprenyl-3-methyl-5-hydroxy-6-metoxy-1,4-benzoquinol methylase